DSASHALVPRKVNLSLLQPIDLGNSTLEDVETRFKARENDHKPCIDYKYKIRLKPGVPHPIRITGSNDHILKGNFTSSVPLQTSYLNDKGRQYFITLPAEVKQTTIVVVEAIYEHVNFDDFVLTPTDAKTCDHFKNLRFFPDGSLDTNSDAYRELKALEPQRFLSALTEYLRT